MTFIVLMCGVLSSADYTTVWNALDYSVCVFPVTRVNPILDPKKTTHNFLNDRDEVHSSLCMCSLWPDRSIPN